jgi:hypothetical protein
MEAKGPEASAKEAMKASLFVDEADVSCVHDRSVILYHWARHFVVLAFQVE